MRAVRDAAAGNYVGKCRSGPLDPPGATGNNQASVLSEA
jgi:hypothetical protein